MSGDHANGVRPNVYIRQYWDNPMRTSLLNDHCKGRAWPMLCRHLPEGQFKLEG